MKKLSREQIEEKLKKLKERAARHYEKSTYHLIAYNELTEGPITKLEGELKRLDDPALRRKGV